MPADRAVFFDGVRSVAVRAVGVPAPGPGDVLVEVAACGVCGSDLHQYLGRWPQNPCAIGHEIGGVVSECGAEVGTVEPGEAVCVEPFLYCGRCRYCQVGRYFHCYEMGFLSLTAHGGMSTRLCVPEYCLYRLPDGVPAELGALCEPLAVGIHGLRLGALCGEQTVLVLGGGTIGLLTAAAARWLGADRVYLTAKYDHQAEAARRLGVEEVLPTDSEALQQRLAEIAPEGPELVVETVGSRAGTLADGLAAARKMGTVVLLGGNTEPMQGLDLAPVIMKELAIVGAGCYGRLGHHSDFELAVRMLGEQTDRLASLVTHRFPLEQAQQAFEVALEKAEHRSVKVLVEGS